MEKELRKETRTYEKLRRYIELEKLTLGFESGFIERKVGLPVIQFQEENGQKWVYKPATSSWFDEDKIYLYFNEDNKLQSWECLVCEKRLSSLSGRGD